MFKRVLLVAVCLAVVTLSAGCKIYGHDIRAFADGVIDLFD
jgi:hypothetical protein